MKHSSPKQWNGPSFEVDTFHHLETRRTTASNGITSAISFWALMSFTALLLLAPHTFYPSLEVFRLPFLTAGVAIGACLLHKINGRKPIIGRTPEMRIITFLVGWAIVTVPLSYWPGGSLSFVINFYLKSVAVFWLLAHVMSDRRRLRLMAWGLSLVAIPLALTGVRKYLSGEFMYIGGIQTDRISGYGSTLTGNPNDLALMLNLILPLAIGLFFFNQRPVRRIVLLGIIVLLVVAVILTFSRAGSLTLAALFLTYQWKLRKRPERRWSIAAFVIALLCVPLLPPTYFERMSTITEIQRDPTGSAQGRWIDTVVGINFVLEKPIVGAGAGMNILALNKERGSWWIGVHNVYLQFAMDLGIPGLVLFLMLLAQCFKSVAFVVRRSAGVPAFRELFYFAEAIQISLVGFAVAGLFHPVAYHFYFYYFAGLAIGVRAIYKAEDSKHTGQP